MQTFPSSVRYEATTQSPHLHVAFVTAKELKELCSIISHRSAYLRTLKLEFRGSEALDDTLLGTVLSAQKSLVSFTLRCERIPILSTGPHGTGALLASIVEKTGLSELVIDVPGLSFNALVGLAERLPQCRLKTLQLCQAPILFPDVPSLSPTEACQFFFQAIGLCAGLERLLLTGRFYALSSLFKQLAKTSVHSLALTSPLEISDIASLRQLTTLGPLRSLTISTLSLAPPTLQLPQHISRLSLPSCGLVDATTVPLFDQLEGLTDLDLSSNPLGPLTFARLIPLLQRCPISNLNLDEVELSEEMTGHLLEGIRVSTLTSITFFPALSPELQTRLVEAINNHRALLSWTATTPPLAPPLLLLLDCLQHLRPLHFFCRSKGPGPGLSPPGEFLTVRAPFLLSCSFFNLRLRLAAWPLYTPHVAHNLRHLDLAAAGIKEFDLAEFPQLRHLNLEANMLTECPHLPFAPHLEVLNLARNSIADLTAFSAHLGHSNLRLLNLNGNLIQGGLAPLASALGETRTLKELALLENQLTAESLQSLAKGLEANFSLEVLLVDDSFYYVTFVLGLNNQHPSIQRINDLISTKNARALRQSQSVMASIVAALRVLTQSPPFAQFSLPLVVGLVRTAWSEQLRNLSVPEQLLADVVRFAFDRSTIGDYNAFCAICGVWGSGEERRRTCVIQ